MKLLTILFIVTSHAAINGTNEPTGLWLEELAAPYYAFIEAGYNVEVASIKGGEVPIDPRSTQKIGENDPDTDRFLQDKEAMARLKNTNDLSNIDVSKYAAIFLPGGHGTMYDLPNSEALATLLSQAWAQEKILAAVCHGPAGLINVKDENGEPIVKGRTVATFTNDEEDAVGLTDAMPFLLETRLEELGATISKAPNFEAHAVADGRLITGQNPPSSHQTAKLVIEALKTR